MAEDSAVREQFDKVDTDKDGFVTKTEFKKSLEGNTKLTDRHVKTIMRLVDDSEDGRISFAEYKKYLAAPPED